MGTSSLKISFASRNDQMITEDESDKEEMVKNVGKIV